MEGLALALGQPHLPSCADCQKWSYDLKTGKRDMRGGQPVPRIRKIAPPCGTCPKSDQNDPRPRPDRELSRRNRQSVEYAYLVEADATGVMPRDELVIRTLSILKRTRETLAIDRLAALPMMLLSAATAASARK